MIWANMPGEERERFHWQVGERIQSRDLLSAAVRQLRWMGYKSIYPVRVK